MNIFKFENFKIRPKTHAVLVFLIVLTITQYLTYQRFLLHKAKEEKVKSTFAINAKERIQSILSYSLSATKTLSFIVKEYGIGENFDTIAIHILENNKYIDALQLVEDSIITRTYPLKGNEAAIGLNILKNPRTSIEANKAIEKKELFFAGPFELRQGGIGVVGRLPIFKNNKYYGFSVAILKLTTLLKEAGIENNKESDFIYQLSKINPQTNEEEFFLPDIPNFKNEFSVSIKIPNGEWRLYIIPKFTIQILIILPLLILGLLLSVLAAFVTFYFADQPRKLNFLVQKRTQELKNSQENYKTTLERVNDAFISVDKDWNLSYINAKAADLFDIKEENIIGKNIFKTISDEFFQNFETPFQKAFSSQTNLNLEEFNEKLQLWFICYIYPSNQGLSVFFRDKTLKKTIELKNQQIQEVFDRITDAFMAFDKNWNYVYLNKKSAEWHNRSAESLIGKNVWEEYPNVVNEGLYQALHQSMETQKPIQIQLYSPQSKKWFEDFIYPSPEGVSVYYQDITDKKLAEEEISKERNLSDSVINSLPGIFYLVNKNGQFLRWNKNLETVTGFSENEISEMRTINFVKFNSLQNFIENESKVFNNGSTEVEAYLITKSKNQIPYFFTGKYIYYNDQPCLVGIGIDISARKTAEEELQKLNEQLRNLTSYLNQVREDERTGIAREIHDELGQQLTGLKMDISWLNKFLGDEKEIVSQKMKDMLALVNETIKTVRRISSDLRPGILDDLGLIAALEWQSKEWEKRSGVKINFESNVEMIELSKEFSIGIFRIYQESLNNIIKHSKADKVEAKFTVIENIVQLSVEDNGIGFDLNAQKDEKSFGLIGMRERILMLGGKINIKSKNNYGTLIEIELHLS